MASLGTEIWLHGTKPDLLAVRGALAPLGTWLEVGDLHPTETAGRFRAYLRLSTAVHASTGRTAPSEPAGLPALDLPAA